MVIERHFFLFENSSLPSEPNVSVCLSAHITIWARVTETCFKYMVRRPVRMGGPRSYAADIMVMLRLRPTMLYVVRLSARSMRIVRLQEINRETNKLLLHVALSGG